MILRLPSRNEKLNFNRIGHCVPFRRAISRKTLIGGFIREDDHAVCSIGNANCIGIIYRSAAPYITFFVYDDLRDMLIVKSAFAKCCYTRRNNNLCLYAISKAVFEGILADIRQGFGQCKYDAFRRISQPHDLQGFAICEYRIAVRITKACQRIRENKGFQGCAIAKRKFADGRYLSIGQVNRCHRRVHKCLIVDLLQIGCIAEIDSNNFFSIKSILTDTCYRRIVNFRRNGNRKGLILIFGKPSRINALDDTLIKNQLLRRNRRQSIFLCSRLLRRRGGQHLHRTGGGLVLRRFVSQRTGREQSDHHD